MYLILIALLFSSETSVEFVAQNNRPMLFVRISVIAPVTPLYSIGILTLML